MSRWLACGIVAVVSLGTLGCGNKPATAANRATEERVAPADSDRAHVASPEAAVDPVSRKSAEESKPEKDGGAEWTTAVDPKPLSENVTRGLAWLVRQQDASGGWAQGEESQNMGRSMDKLKDKANVGDTCMAVLALMRSGSTPKEGPYAENVRDGLDFVCKEIAASKDETLHITSVRGTRLQMKLGTYIDTFLSSMLLAEAKDGMPDDEGNRRVYAALDKVMDKIEKNQRADGTFGGTGWANSLSVSMAGKGYNRAVQAGYATSELVRERLEADGQAQFDVGGGDFAKGRSAGVDLYASAASLSQMQDSDNTNADMRPGLVAKLGAPETAPDEKATIRKTLKRYDDNLTRMEAAQTAIVAKLDDKSFIAGFGSNGGEEFLSYMNIGESLVVKGGETWEKWDKDITANLNRIQNKDGSWTGHHCITGRTFCTSASLLVLMTDRAPVPVAAKIKRR
ncbi:MAG: prenyltransferase/squalene oxidase repeat-containing protein [Planctomycetota bacterium]|jgi:hypothetical protein